MAWVITGMVRNQGLLLSNIEVIRSAASSHLLELVFVANDDDPLATKPFLDTVEHNGARVLRLPHGHNGSWDLLSRQPGQLEYAWNQGRLNASGASILVRSRTDLWLKGDYVNWLCTRGGELLAEGQKIHVRGIHATLPSYAEDLVLAANTDSVDLLFGVHPELVARTWHAHNGLMVHLARFSIIFDDVDALGMYEDALAVVERAVRMKTWGELHWKAVTSTLPGGFWRLHEAALGVLHKRGQLLEFLQRLQAVAERNFVLIPQEMSPGSGLDRGLYTPPWRPKDARKVVRATSTDFVSSFDDLAIWARALQGKTDDLQEILNDSLEGKVPEQRLSEAAFIGVERLARKAFNRIGNESRTVARQLRRRLPPS